MEATENFELWLDEHQDNDELVGSELLEKAQTSLKAAQDFIEEIEETEGDEGIVNENMAEETTEETTTEVENGEEVMEPAESSDEEED
jgi:hypothetical protein